MMKGLVVSSEDEIRRRLAEILDENGLAPIHASSVDESGMRLSGCKVQIVVCQDRLVDGEYDAILRIMRQINAGVPAIVFSRTGDWPENLTALRTGVFDYLAYPPLRGEFERTLQNALRECETQCPFSRNRIRVRTVLKDRITVLLVGDGICRFPRLVQWLSDQGCYCEFAASYRDACSVLSRAEFDIVLSEYQLPDRTAYPLLDWLVGTPATLLFCARVEDDFLWLKMLEQGERRLDVPVLRSNDLLRTLGQVLTDTAMASRPEGPFVAGQIRI